MELSKREQAFLDLCMAGTEERYAALQSLTEVCGARMTTTPVERARVALELANRGFDGIARVNLAMKDVGTALAETN